MSNAKDMTAANFEAEVLKSEIPVLVDFWAPWCGPCRMVGPILDELAGEYEGKVKIVKVNVDEETALAQSYGIMSIPAVYIFKGGETVERMVGARPKSEFAAKLDKLV